MPRIAESSPGVGQKGTKSILAIRGSNPLVLPNSMQGNSRAPNPKASEVALPSLVIISLKMFSLVPNLQTQEGLIIRMPKPFPYKDNHRVLWKYDMTLISTRIGKEKVCSNVSSGLFGLTNVDTTFCTPYDSGPRSLLMLNSKAQGWFTAQSDVKLT